MYIKKQSNSKAKTKQQQSKAKTKQQQSKRKDKAKTKQSTRNMQIILFIVL